MTTNTFHAPALLLPWEQSKGNTQETSQGDTMPHGPSFYTQNFGHHSDTWKRFAEIIKEHKPDHIGWQETGDQGVPLRKIAEETGYRLFDGSGLPGQSSTPIMYNPDAVKFMRPFVRFLHHPARIKTNGGGTMMLKTKWLIGGVFHSPSGTYIHVNGHWVFNQDMQPNGSIATDTSRNAAERTRDARHPIGMTADFNMAPSSPRAAPLRNAGYRSARAQLSIQTKHGEIDDLKVKGMLRIKRGIAVHSTSDHDGVIVWTELAV